MRRTGYDAESQTYQFQDADGVSYEGPPGARFGELLPGKKLKKDALIVVMSC